MKVERNEELKFLKITPDEGMVLTSWKEGDDIKEYSSSTLMYCPWNYDATVLREITEAEDMKHKEEQKAAYEAEENKRKMEDRV